MRRRRGVRRARRPRARASATASRCWPRPASCRARCCATASLRFVVPLVAILPERLDTPFTRGRRRPAAAPHAGRPRRGLLLRRRGDARRARARRPGPVPLRRRDGAGCGRTTGQPERLAARDRRRLQRRGQRGRADAAPGAGGRGAPRHRRRHAADPALAGGERRPGARPQAPPRRQSTGGAGRRTGAPRPRPPAPRSTAPLGPDRRASWTPSERKLGRAPERPRAGHVQRDVERALLLQELAGRCLATPADARPRTWSPARARTPASIAHRRRPGGGLQDRVAQPPVARSSRTRARRPASAASCATSSRWAPGRSRSSTPSASATRRTPRTRHLVDGVVRGVGGYGNCVGVPTVGGELVFDPSYQGNPLVNVMAIGLLEERHADPARRRPGPGNLVGALRLGHRAATASAARRSWPARRSATRTRRKRPTVQVGDPFAEKLLIEASLELIARRPRRGPPGPGRRRDHLRHLRDRPTGPAPACCVDLDAIPRREPGMAPFEVMISESQERMLAIVPARAATRPCARSARAGACRRRSSAASPTTATSPIIEGGLDADGRRVAGARELARIPAAALTSARRSSTTARRRAAGPTPRRRPAPGRPGRPRGRAARSGAWTRARCCSALLGSPNLSSAGAGSTSSTTVDVQANTVAGPGRGAAVLRVKGTRQGARRHDRRQRRPSARSTRSSARRCPSPRRRATCRSPAPGRWASPTASTTAIPTRPEAFWQLREAVRGLADACRALGLPVTGGNVSLYNESPGSARSRRRPRSASSGLLDDVVAAGRAGVRGGRRRRRARRARRARAWPASAYAALAGATAEDGPPGLDLAREAALQAFVREAIARGLVGVGPGRLRRRPRGGAGGDVHLGRAAARTLRLGVSAARRPSSCSARARRGSS